MLADIFLGGWAATALTATQTNLYAASVYCFRAGHHPFRRHGRRVRHLAAWSLFDLLWSHGIASLSWTLTPCLIIRVGRTARYRILSETSSLISYGASLAKLACSVQS